jgi:predicted N-acyltransferase
LDKKNVKVEFINDINLIEKKQWDLCACPEAFNGEKIIDPFTTYNFISALENSGSVGKGTGWHSCHLVVKIEKEIIAVMPLYLKGHSQGEYIFDHNWAQAYNNFGGNYYPKIQSAVPFTPATGRRFLTKKGFEKQGRDALERGIINLALNNKLSSAHITFCTSFEAKKVSDNNFLKRKTLQYHWENKGFSNFEDFLNSLSSRKRKTIKKERKIATSLFKDNDGIFSFTGSQLRDKHWDSFWKFYQDTGNRKWGIPYLTRDFFQIINECMPENILLFLAIENDTPIAGALNFIGADTLYGRYWGCSKYHSCLHYELCYYQAIDYALKNRIKKVEAGAQGEHKISRGYLPSFVYSLHWFSNKSFASAISEYLDKEEKVINQEYDILMKTSPYKQL